jgi:hypothetical protein
MVIVLIIVTVCRPKVAYNVPRCGGFLANVLTKRLFKHKCFYEARQPPNAKPLLVAGVYCFGLIGIQISSSEFGSLFLYLSPNTSK